MAIINKHGLAEPPVYPCNKGEGLCDMRIVETDEFQCVYEAGTCKHRKVIKAKSETDEAISETDEAKSETDETSKHWDSLGSRK